MNNKEFDKSLKNKIDSLVDESDHKSDWNSFSRILKKQEGFESLNFDDKVRNYVSIHTSKYNSDHWHQLKTRLEKESRIHQHIYISKGTELFSVLLLVFAFVQYFLNDVYPTNSQINNVQPILERAGILPIKTTKNPTLPIVNVVNNIEHSLKNNIVAMNNSNGLESSSLNFNKAKEPNISPLPIVFRPNLVYNKTIVCESSNHKSIKTVASEKPKSFLTPLTSFGLNITKTPANISTNETEKLLLSSHFGAGLLFSTQYDNIEFGTGIIIGRKNYKPLPQTNYVIKNRNLYKEEVRNIKYDFATIPIRAKYLFGKKTDDIKPYIMGGADINILLNSRYDLTSEDLGRVSSLTLNNNNNPRNDLNNSTPEGLFSGGSLKSNLYLSVSAEAGIEKQISQINSVIFGISYSKYFNIEGLGPNKDKYDNLSFNVGLKHSLSDN
jgi:hypothetical protein